MRIKYEKCRRIKYGVSILAIHHNLFRGSQLDVNAKTYEVIKFLGKGKGGYSYLATDGD